MRSASDDLAEAKRAVTKTSHHCEAAASAIRRVCISTFMGIHPAALATAAILPWSKERWGAAG
jgi:hypothetical protein